MQMRDPTYYKQLSKASFDLDARKYDRHCGPKYNTGLYPHVLHLLQQKKFDTILDVGIGTGTVFDLLQKEKPFQGAGLDISSEMIKVAKTKLGNQFDLRKGECDDLPWESNQFDIVMSLYTLHHIINPGVVLKEMYRVLRPNGFLIIGDVLLLPIVRQILNLILSYRSRLGDARIHSEQEMAQYADDNGFSKVWYRRYGIHNYLLTAEKPRIQ